MPAKRILLLLILTLSLTGCFIKVNKNPVGSQEGVFISSNLGDSWQNISNLLSVKEPQNFAAANINLLVRDPQDEKVIYAGTRQNGMYYTINGGEGWQLTLANIGGVNDIAISYFDRCTVYVAMINQLYKTTDCNRNWQSVFNESQVEKRISAVATDPKDKNVVYMANNQGSFYQSINQGKSWKTLYNFNADIRKIIISKKNTIYVSTLAHGIFQSLDSGITWTNISTAANTQWSGFINWRELLLDPNNQSRLLYANNYGIFESLDEGKNWRSLPLLTPPNSVMIDGLSMSYKDIKKIYYVANNTFYLSVDGGQNWTTKQIPTSSSFVVLLSIPSKEEVIYAGAAKKQ